MSRLITLQKDSSGSLFDLEAGITPKLNVIAPLEFELSYYDVAIQPANHYTTRTLPR